MPAHEVAAARKRRSAGTQVLNAVHVGHVGTILAPVLRPGGDDVEIADVYRAYLKGCAASDASALDTSGFHDAIRGLAKQIGVEIDAREDGVYHRGVMLDAV